MQLNVSIIRSTRKTISLEITKEGQVIVRAPHRAPEREIRSFVESKRPWIVKHLAMIEQRREEQEGRASLSEEDRQTGIELAKHKIPERVAYYAPIVGVTYGRITIREQKTRWGSCSSKGNLNFNWKLAIMPDEILDYVVVHELCHRLEMNHSPRFWAEVARIIPDYLEKRNWLKTNGWKY